MKERIKRYSFIKGQNGFTLVELMVVLAILAILSSVAVFSIIGYIDRARFDKNEQNAQSMYQAVQGALERKKNSGEVEDWIVNELMAKGTQDPYDTGTNPNHDKDAAGNVADQCYAQDTFNNFPRPENTVGDSVHMRYFLTYTKGATGGDNAVIMDLVGRYFYDTTILDATFTIEFDVEKILGGDEETHYAVNTYAVFYDEKRIGWDAEALKVTSTEVPWRDSAYRSDTSLVGYYNGGHPGAVDSVYTPIVNNKMTFAELAMRNSEKLELSFSAVNGAEQITGTGKYNVHYTASIYEQLSDSEEKWMADLVISEAYMANGTPNGNAPVDWTKLKPADPNVVQNGAMQMVNIDGTGKTWPVVYSYEHMTDDQNKPFIRIKASTETMALVYVNTEGHDNFDYNTLPANKLSGGFFRFPMTVSYVIKKYSETDVKEYVSYSIALDAMMSRSAAYSARQDAAKKEYNYSIRRLVLPDGKEADGSDRISPKNINVSMIVAEDAFTDESLAQYNKPSNLPASESKKAKRAYDDPVYLLGDGNYAYREDASIRDQYAGHAVCNTYFGDLGEGSTGSGSATEQHVCITAFRHLYNMRYTTEFAPETDVAYCIERDLNWYRKVGEDYTSEVEVYDLVTEEVTTGGNNGNNGNNGNHNGWTNGNGHGNGHNNGNGGNGNHYGWTHGNGNIGNNTGGETTQYVYLQGFSPVGIQNRVVSNNELKLVSWPALPVMGANQCLFAKEYDLDDGTAKTPVIRNVQMRRWSFLSTDKGLGFICQNNGKISNLRCENLCLTLDKTEDGDSLDLAAINTSIKTLSTAGNDNRIDRPNGVDAKVLQSVPVGGLVGLNNKTLGDTEGDENLIQMSNTIVLAGVCNGTSWSLCNGLDNVGGVIGKHSSATAASGSIMSTGCFVVSGYKNVGGIVGYADTDMDAYLIADSSIDRTNAIVLPEEIGCLVMGRSLVGGAVGAMSGGSFAQEITDLTYKSDADGVVTVEGDNENAKFGVSVNLVENSLVWQFGNEASDGVGGAIGKVTNHPAGKKLSVRNINSGTILSGVDQNGKYVGGAIGCLQGGSATRMYISAQNNGKIGTQDGSTVYGKSYAAAVGIACIKEFGTDSDTYVFHVQNDKDAILSCNTNKTKNDVGAGCAIGVLLTKTAYPNIWVNAVNAGTINVENVFDGQTGNDYWRNKKDFYFGVGGAAGYLYGLQNGSHIYAELADDSSIIANGNNVGGAVGCIQKETKGTNGKIVTVTAELGKSIRIESAGINVGGCIGNLRGQSSYSEIRSIVKGNAEVQGYLNVGGVVGCDQQEGAATGASIVLKGDAAAPKLTVKGSSVEGTIEATKNINVGGVIGAVGTRSAAYSTNIISPSQGENNKLVLDVDGGQHTGGMAGCVYLHDLHGDGHHYGVSDAVTYDVTIHPNTTITGVEQYVGGAIGYVYEDRNKTSDFAANINVTILSGNISEEGIVKGTANIGGVIGAAYLCNMTGTISSNIASPYAVCGNKSIGGSIGYFDIQYVVGQVNATVKASKAIVAEGGDGGGCIGVAGGNCVVDHVGVVLGDTETETDIMPVYGAGNYLGGCIGRIGGNAGGPHITTVLADVYTSGSVITTADKNITGIGGVIGDVKKSSIVDSVSMSGREQGTVLSVLKGEDVGTLVGLVEETSKISAFSVSNPITVEGRKNVGGYFGLVKKSTLGKSEDPTFSINHIISVKATEGGGNHSDGGTGAFAGAITDSSTLYCPVSITLGTESSIRGGFNTGGVIGLVSASVLKGDLTSNLQGVYIYSDKGGLGGVIGSLQGTKDVSAVVKNLTANLSLPEDAESTTYTLFRAIKDNSGTGIGGVVGQIGGWSRNNEEHRTYPIQIDNITLNLQCNLTIPIGKTSVGGVIGQCESSNATIENIKVYSSGAEIHVEPPKGKNPMDIGGIIGNMLGGLEKNIDVENVDFYVIGKQYVGGWIGAMDGRLGTDGVSRTVEVTGIKYVEGSDRGVGGFIGATGCWRSTAKMYDNIKVDLTDATIKNTGKGNGEAIYIMGAGGVIGLVGDPKGDVNNHSTYSSLFYGNVEVLLKNTTIRGYGNVGAIYGYLREGSNIAKGTEYKIYVEGSCSVISEKSTNADNNAGGMVGKNEASFLPSTVIEIPGGSSLYVTAAGGYAGGIMGKNGNVFGRSSDSDFTIPEGGGRIVVEGSKTGAILGYNGDSANNTGKCGAIVVGGTDSEDTDATLIYHISNVELKGDYDTTDPRSKYVGENKYAKDEFAGEQFYIYNVETDDGTNGEPTP